MARNLVCGECGGTFQEGFIVETAAGVLGLPFAASYWMEGTDIKRSFWTLKLKTIGRKKYYITAYRCERCGFMKFYAGPDHSAEK